MDNLTKFKNEISKIFREDYDTDFDTLGISNYDLVGVHVVLPASVYVRQIADKFNIKRKTQQRPSPRSLLTYNFL